MTTAWNGCGLHKLVVKFSLFEYFFNFIFWISILLYLGF